MKEIEFQKRVIELLESIAGACARAEQWTADPAPRDPAGELIEPVLTSPRVVPPFASQADEGAVTAVADAIHAQEAAKREADRAAAAARKAAKKAARRA